MDKRPLDQRPIHTGSPVLVEGWVDPNTAREIIFLSGGEMFCLPSNKVKPRAAGGQTAEKDAPGREATLTSVAVQYKILNNKPTATIKVWGYD